MIRAIALAFALAASTSAYAAPHATHDSAAVTAAKHAVDVAKGRLKAIKASEHAQATAGKRTSKIAKLKAQIAKLQHDDTQPSEDRCRALAHKGETWEDACERVYHVNPLQWNADGSLRDAGEDLGCGDCTDNHDGSCTCD